MPARRSTKTTPPPKERKKEFRSKFEAKIARQLKKAGVPFTFERNTLPYIRNGKVSKYTPDFNLKAFYIETKGYFVGGARDRLKLILVKQQHPECDLRLLFQRETQLISPDSTMTYADWAETWGFPYAGGRVPQEWLDEAKAQVGQVH